MFARGWREYRGAAPAEAMATYARIGELTFFDALGLLDPRGTHVTE